MNQEQHITWKEQFEQMDDPRGTKGRRYPWWVLLMLIAWAMVSGQKNPTEISQWVKEHEPMLRERVWNRMPSDATMRRALQAMPIKQLESIMYPPLETSLPLQARAIDGKAIRGATNRGTKLHVIRELVQETGQTVHQEIVEEKTNEIPVVQRMLEGRDLTGLLFTIDAMHTQVQTAQLIESQHGKYLLVAKDNQPTLAQTIEEWFASEPWPEEDREQFIQVGKSHGRQERRVLERIVCPPRLRSFWPGVRQIFRRTCQSTILSTGQTRFQVTYGLTNLAPEQGGSLVAIATFWRGHWCIENTVHYTLDPTWLEDSCLTFLGNAPLALSVLRTGITHLLRQSGFSNIRAALRHFSACPLSALSLIGC
jgi:predicted transposase YbfD/YdcC